MITIDEAVKAQEEAPLDDLHIFSPRLRDAMKLGIEALKRLNKARHGAAEPIYYLLPGETKD